MPPEPRVTQLARILQQDPATLEGSTAAREAVDANPGTLANAFFHEAADSDDVTSVSAALDYLEGRITFFGDFISTPTATEIRSRFRELVSPWEE